MQKVEGSSPFSRSHKTLASFTALVPGGLHIPRTVLEWRIAVDSRGATFISAASTSS